MGEERTDQNPVTVVDPIVPRVIPPGPLVYVGAHHGNGIVREVRDRGAWYTEVIAFEPSPMNLAELQDRFLQPTKPPTRGIYHDGRFIPITILPVAVTDDRSKKVATLNFYGIEHGSDSLGRMTAESVSKIAHCWPAGALDFRGSAKVACVTLEDALTGHLVESIRTLVVDAQGMDLTIVKSIRSWFERGAVGRVQAEVDKDEFSHYSGLPTNALRAWREFFAGLPTYHHASGPIGGWTEPTEIQADITWELVQ